MNFNEFEKRILKDSVKKFTKEQLEKFKRLFWKMMKKKSSIMARSDDKSAHCSGLRIAPGKRKRVGCTVDIHCSEKNKAHKMEIYVMKRNNNYSIYDVSLEGALLSRNYRASINKIIRKHGVDELLARIERKTTNIEELKKRKPI